MEETYKQHVIRAGAVPVPTTKEWKPLAQVDWVEEGTQRAKHWREWHFDRSFQYYEEAQMVAYICAKNWIDAQKNSED